MVVGKVKISSEIYQPMAFRCTFRRSLDIVSLVGEYPVDTDHQQSISWEPEASADIITA